MFMEIWKKIEGFENYEISNYGRLKGLEVKTKFGSSFKIYPERICSLWSDKKGYKYFTFIVNGKNRHKLIHRLVAIAFIENPLNKKQVNHKNGIKSDNYVSNLEWCTSKENINHAIDNGLIKNSGLDNYTCKITEKDIINIRESNLRQRELCNIYNVSQTTISKIKLNKTYKHVGV